MTEQEKKRMIISECLSQGDWGRWGDVISRNDLIEYLMFYTNPEIEGEALKIKKLPKVDCPLCGAPVKPQAFAMTKRNVMYLMSLNYLSKQDIAKGGDGYIHYEVIHDFCQGKFKHDKGKRLGAGISFTSYGTMTKAPWDLMTSRQTTNDKTRRDGCFKLTQRGTDFLNCKIAIPERLEILDNKVVRFSKKLVLAAKVKDINWQQCLEIYKTF